MNFEVPTETTLLIETVRRFVTNELQPLEPEVEECGHVPPERLMELRAKARSLGLYAMNMPPEVGGAGLSMVELCLVEEEFGKTSDALIRRVFGQVYPMLTACRGAQRERYLIPTVKGERICAMAITEPGAGSDAASISTTARRDGQSWILNGRKHFISDGDIADYAIVMAVTDTARRAHGGITLFLIDKGTAGFVVGRRQPMMGHRGYGHSELIFEDCHVGNDQILGDLGEGFRLIMQTVGAVRLAHIGARSVGMAQRLLELMRSHANERRQFGKSIGEFQMVQQMIADSAIDIFACRSMVLNAAWEIDNAREAREKISMIKVFASEMIGRVADRAMQIFGGMGYSKELAIERIYRDSRVTRIYDGTSEIHRIIVAKHVLKNGFLL